MRFHTSNSKVKWVRSPGIDAVEVDGVRIKGARSITLNQTVDSPATCTLEILMSEFSLVDKTPSEMDAYLSCEQDHNL